MKKIGSQQIIDHVAEMCIEANTFLSADMMEGLHRAKGSEESENGKEILETMLCNFEVAKNKNMIPPTPTARVAKLVWSILTKR